MSTIVTGTPSMQFNAGSQRANSSTIMNYTNRKISSVAIKVDSLRLAFTSNSGQQQNVAGTTAGTGLESDYVNVFHPSVGVVPTISKFSPTVQSAWNTANPISPVYNGEAGLISIFGHVVLRLNGALTTANVLQLAVFVDDTILGSGTPGYSNANSPYNAIGVPQQTSSGKSTTDLTINVVLPLTKGQSVSLRIRNSTTNPISYDYFQANLYCRPIELNGVDAVSE